MYDEPEELNSVEPTTVPDHTDIDEVDKISLAKSLGIDKISEIKDYDDHLSRLVSWAKSQGAVDRIDILAMIKQLGTRLGDRSVRNMSTYAYLELERAKLDAKIRRLEAK